MKYLITVKLPKNPNHDPRNKKIGPCPVFGGMCTDSTGEHHTGLIESNEGYKSVHGAWAAQYHVTRIEIIL